MAIDKKKAADNIEYARRWLKRGNADFNLFKKLVRFDNRTVETIRCSDPALAVYLLQQTIEKAVKAIAVATGQYEVGDGTSLYRHNSLALILDVNAKLVTKLKDLGLGDVAAHMGIDISDGEAEIGLVESQVLGRIPLISKEGNKVNLKQETLSLSPEAIDRLLDLSMNLREKILETVAVAFDLLAGIGVKGDHPNVGNLEEFSRAFGTALSRQMNTAVSEEQLKVPTEFAAVMAGLGVHSGTGPVRRDETTANYLAVWSFSYSLLWLTYITYAHESSSRYPLKRKGDAKAGRLGCDDYTEQLGIVSRLGRLGYAASLTLNELRNEIQGVAYLFAANQVETADLRSNAC